MLADAELAAVWRAADSGALGPIVKVLILTGQRREEVAAIRWSELDLQGAAWRLPAERTKNKRPHDVPLSAPVLEILAGVPVREERDLLFGELKQFIERIERLEEEKAGIAGDIKDVFSELKGRGFDAKAIRAILRIRKQDHAERQDEDAILELYMQALGMM